MYKVLAAFSSNSFNVSLVTFLATSYPLFHSFSNFSVLLLLAFLVLNEEPPIYSLLLALNISRNFSFYIF